MEEEREQGEADLACFPLRVEVEREKASVKPQMTFFWLRSDLT